MNEEDIKTLIKTKKETKNCDYKYSINWEAASRPEKGKIIKDILAFSNTQDGGVLIFGVDDETYDVVGMPEDDFKSFDQTKVNDFLIGFTDPKYTCQVVKYRPDGKNVVAIICPEFAEIPIICINNLDDEKNRTVLQKGAVYMRTEKASSETISNSEDMREFIGRTISKKSDHLLNQIARLMKGKGDISEVNNDEYLPEINDANEFASNVIGKSIEQKGCWEVGLFPVIYKKGRFIDQPSARKGVESSSVFLRGWKYPHTDNTENSSNFKNGFQSFFIGEKHVEAYRIHKSGLFVWKSRFWEEILKDGNTGQQQKVLSFIGAIYTITEILCFAKRLYEGLLQDDEELLVQIIMKNVKGRRLVSLDVAIELYESLVAQEDFIVIERRINAVELKSFYKETAAGICKELFLLFNWNDIQDKTIEHWQTKLLARMQ